MIMFGLSHFELNTIVQLVYLAVVWGAVPTLLGRPLIELAFTKWVPATYPIPTRLMLLVRAVALAALVVTTLAMPATDQTLPPDASPYAHIAEASAIFIITFATIFGIVRPTISKAFETFGVIIQPSIDKARAEIEEAEKQAKEQGLKQKPFSFIRMAVVYGISLAFVFFVIYLLRKVTGDIGNWDKVNNLFDTLLDPESLEKKNGLLLPNWQSSQFWRPSSYTLCSCPSQ